MFGVSGFAPSCCHSVFWSGSFTVELLAGTHPNSA